MEKEQGADVPLLSSDLCSDTRNISIFAWAYGDYFKKYIQTVKSSGLWGAGLRGK